MKTTSKATLCKTCGQEMPDSAKWCPHCGAKNKKPVYKKWWFWTIIDIMVLGTTSPKDTDTAENTPASSPIAESSPVVSTAPDDSSDKVSPESATPEIEAPDIELSTDFEREVYDIVKNHNGKLFTINTVNSNSENLEEATVNAGVLCENNESVVNAILSETSEVVKSNGTNEGIAFTFGDIKKGDDAPTLVIAVIYPDGTIHTSFTSTDYNSERNHWINNQFSAWDGSHKELERLIIRNLNDEDSYKHIETTYRDISDESIRDEVNQVLADAGYTQRVEVGDLFIRTQFSAKNAFGGTIKNTAFGIASYNNNTITLVDIG